MKVKRIKIGVKDVKTALDDFVKTGEAILKGTQVKTEKGVYFENFESIRKALTPKRLELLHFIKTLHPASINELARMCKRDIKNVSTDVLFLERIGLIERTEQNNRTAPTISYDRISLEIAV